MQILKTLVILWAVVVLLACLMTKKGLHQLVLGVQGRQDPRIKIHADPLVRHRGVDLHVMGLRRAHQQNVPRLQGIGSALHIEGGPSAQKAVKLRIDVGVHEEVLLGRLPGKKVGDVQVRRLESKVDHFHHQGYFIATRDEMQCIFEIYAI